MHRALQYITLLLAISGTAKAAPNTIHWTKSFDTALAEANRTNKLVMLDFYAEWCSGCKRLEKDTYTDARVIQLAGQFVPIKLNGDKDGRALAKTYNVVGFPTILFINSTGEVEGTIGGYMLPEEIVPKMSRIAQAHQEFPQLVVRIMAKPEDAATAAKLAAIYAGRGNITKAEAMLGVAEKDQAEAGASLAIALSSLGDYYQSNNKFDRAIPFFQKANKVGPTPNEIAYALISEAACYFQSTRPKEAVKPLEALLKLDGAPKQWVTQGKQMLEQARKIQ